MLIMITTPLRYDYYETMQISIVDLHIATTYLLNIIRCSTEIQYYHLFFKTLILEDDMRPNLKHVVFSIIKMASKTNLYQY